MACPGCSKGNNIYATTCAHCGIALTPAPKPAPIEDSVREPCPRCSHTQFVVVTSLGVPETPPGDRVAPFYAICVEDRDDQGRLAGRVPVTAGRFHAYVCLGCGYTQLFATELARLARLARTLPNAKVITVPTPTPYRG